jgi:dipeptidyl aminopeptidase/acylaminoacyl peptidase
MKTLLLVATAFLLPAPADAARDATGNMLKAYQRAEAVGSPAAGRLVAAASVQPHWLSGRAAFWYLRTGPGVKEFILVDADAGTRRPAFDHAKLAAALSRASGAKVAANALPFAAISPSDDLKAVGFRVGSQWWSWNDGDATLIKTEAPSTQPDGPGREGPRRDPAAPGNGERPGGRGRSPDGKWTAFIKDDNVWLRDALGAEIPLSTDGAAKDAYTEHFSWSPDSARLVVWRTQPGDRLPMYAIESAPSDGSLRPKLRTYAYDLPGDRLDVSSVYVFDIQSKKSVKAQTEPVDYGDVPEPRWSRDGRTFTFEQTFRALKRERIVEVDAVSGAARDIIDERSDTFVFPPCRFVEYLDDTGEIIWASERSGWNHLYLFDAKTGKVKNAVTSGEWVVRQVDNVDREARTITFAASGKEAGEDPYLIHWYRVNLDGSGLTPLTPGNGHHSIRWSPDRRYYLDTYSRADQPPVTELRRTSDGSLVLEVDRADDAALRKTGWRRMEPFVAKGRDGKTDIWGVIVRPSNLDPKRKYPVIENIYAGPQDSFVPKTYSTGGGMRALAELGFIVVQIDGMGTANRSKAFHDVCYRNLGDSGFPDRIAWMKAAAAKYPYMDISRVGVYGASAGGYNAARALIAHPEFYKAACAMSGNHDHRTDKTWWNEAWMGYPVGPHYAEQSNIENAAKLKGSLLLVHGELDDNVPINGSSLRFADALIKANKDFEQLVVPGAGHGFGSYVTRRMWDFFVRTLQGKAPPVEFNLRSGGGDSVDVKVTNNLDRPVTLFWVESPGNLRPYNTLKPGETVTRHTYVGHEWEAHADGQPVSWYTGSVDQAEWVIAN